LFTLHEQTEMATLKEKMAGMEGEMVTFTDLDTLRCTLSVNRKTRE
jgi:hypothetical protein